MSPQDKAMTVGELHELLKRWKAHQKLVFTDVKFGDFNLIGFAGAFLSPDNFEKDIRPILRLKKR